MNSTTTTANMNNKSGISMNYTAKKRGFTLYKYNKANAFINWKQ